jgi:hypothetical protein
MFDLREAALVSGFVGCAAYDVLGTQLVQLAASQPRKLPRMPPVVGDDVCGSHRRERQRLVDTAIFEFDESQGTTRLPVVRQLV